MKKTKCPTCGQLGDFLPVTFPMLRELDGRRFSGDVPARQCPNCGEKLVSGPGLGLFDDALTAELARSGNVGPRGFRWLRGRAQLEGKRLAELLDVTPGSVSRWEHGKQALDRRAVALVSALALDALDGQGRTRGILEALAAGKKGPRRVKIDVSEAAKAKR